MTEHDRLVAHLEHLATVDRWCWWRRHPFLTPWPLAAVADPTAAKPALGAVPLAPGAGFGVAGLTVTATPPVVASGGAVLAGGEPGRPHLSVVATSVSEASTASAFGTDVGAPGYHICPTQRASLPPGRSILGCPEASRISGSHP